MRNLNTVLYGSAMVNRILSQCPSNPTDSGCAAFTMSDANITASSGSLCKQMPGMPSCELQKSCASRGKSDSYCSPFALYATQCTDMNTMSDCSTYNKMCGSNPSVALPSQCKALPLTAFPSTEKTTQLIYGICTSMTMSGCETCKIKSAEETYASCDLIGTYAKLCQAMPDMSQCQAWKSMCKATPDLPYCESTSTGSATAPPEMRMYFHTGISDYVLFQTWVPRTGGQYALYWSLCFLLAIVYEALQVFVTLQEVKWSQEAFSSNSKSDTPFWVHIAGLSHGFAGFKVAVARGLLRIITSTLAYALMLVAMTFNVGLFFSVIGGFGLGTVLFAPIAKHYQASAVGSDISKSYDCH
ncbi:hypothetical protein HDV02_005899 [Globomyces sp. JEL0801]|nr:hypothetical protein HDV02_005899 [Globomyces sp. JEL0801]